MASLNILRCKSAFDAPDNSIAIEDARDLSLIRRKLERGDYSSARQVDDEISLMLENAKVFNGEGLVVDAANAF